MQVPATFSLGRTVARIFQRRGHRGYSPDCHVDRCRPPRRALTTRAVDEITLQKNKFIKGGFSTRAFTANILSKRFRHLNIVGCLLKRRPTKGGHGHPRTPPSYAPVTAEHLCHEHQETTISSNKTVTNRAFSHDITVAKLVFQNNEMSPVL